MKQNQLYLSLLVALLAICTQAKAQGVISPIGLVSDKLSFSVGEVVVSEKAGFWAIDATLTSGVEGVISQNDVKIKMSADSGDIEISMPKLKKGLTVAYSLYTVGGKLIRSERITETSTVIKTGQTAGREPIILTVTEGGKPIATVKIIQKN